MNLKSYKSVTRVSRSSELNEGDPIYIEVKTTSNLYKFLGRYVEVEEFKNNCLSKEMRVITSEALAFFERGNMNLCHENILLGSKKVWILSEKDVKDLYDKGMHPDNFKRWRKR